MLNRSRNIFNQIVNKRRPQSVEIQRAIEVGKELEDMTKTRGWKHLKSFIEVTNNGGIDILDKDNQVVGVWSLTKAFNLFLQWLMISHERRAYRKINNFVNLSIKKGKEYAEQQRLVEERRTRSERKSEA